MQIYTRTSDNDRDEGLNRLSCSLLQKHSSLRLLIIEPIASLGCRRRVHITRRRSVPSSRFLEWRVLGCEVFRVSTFSRKIIADNHLFCVFQTLLVRTFVPRDLVVKFRLVKNEVRDKNELLGKFKRIYIYWHNVDLCVTGEVSKHDVIAMAVNLRVSVRQMLLRWQSICHFDHSRGSVTKSRFINSISPTLTFASF